MQRKQFTFYRSYYEALQPLSYNEQANIILAVCDYALNQTEPMGLSPAESAAFNLIRPTLDSGRRKALAGQMGGEANCKQTESKPKANGKQTASKKEGENEKEKEGEYEIEKEIEKESYTPLPPSGGGAGGEIDSVIRLYAYLTDNYPTGRQDYLAMRDLESQIKSPADIQLMVTNLGLWQQSEQWAKGDGQYIPRLSNWIRYGKWREKPGKMAIPKGASGELGAAELEAIERLMREG